MSWYSLIRYIEGLFPDESFTLSLQGSDFIISFKITIKDSSFNSQLCEIPSNMLSIADNTYRIKKILRYLKKTYKTSSNFIFQIKLIINLFKDLFESPIPTPTNRAKLLWQKLIYRYTQYGVHWDCYPTPFLFNEQFRYMIYASGTRLNLRRLSYWSLPHLVNHVMCTQWGLSAQIIVVIGNEMLQIKNTKALPGSKNYNLFLLSLTEGMITKIKPLDSQEFSTFFSQSDFKIDRQAKKSEQYRFKKSLQTQILSKYRMEQSNKLGYVNSIIWMSKNFLESLMVNLIFNVHSHTFFPLRHMRKILRKVKDPKEFSMYPENSGIINMKKVSISKFIRDVSLIITDQAEF